MSLLLYLYLGESRALRCHSLTTHHIQIDRPNQTKAVCNKTRQTGTCTEAEKIFSHLAKFCANSAALEACPTLLPVFVRTRTV